MTAALIREEEIHLLPQQEVATRLAAQMKSGDYVVVEPSLSGWGYVTHHYNEEVTRKALHRGHDKCATVATLAITLGQPCVVSDCAGPVWQAQTESRLLKLGATVVREKWED